MAFTFPALGKESWMDIEQWIMVSGTPDTGQLMNTFPLFLLIIIIPIYIGKLQNKAGYTAEQSRAIGQEQ